MSDESTTTSTGPGTSTPPAVPGKPKAKKSRKRATTKRASTSKADKLNEKQTAVLQLVTLAPAPRTAEELATSYAGIRDANLWPEQSVDQVKAAIDALVGKKVLKKGAEAPNGEPTIEIA